MTVTLGPRAAHMRRDVGPLAWSALEVLAASSRTDGEMQLAPASVRSVAAELGVAVNTAQRAMARLRAAGLVEQSQRRLEGGRFDAATYRLNIPADVLRLEAVSFEPIVLSELNPSSSKRAPVLGQQLVLLPS